VQEEEVERVLGRLIDSGGLDDERFARRFAEDKRDLAGWGPDRIRGALVARGISEATVASALADDRYEDQLARAVALLQSRDTVVDSESARARALGLLARRGFSAELAYEAIRCLEREAA
jgi:regulatory protein